MVNYYVQSNIPNQWLSAQRWQKDAFDFASAVSFFSIENRSHSYAVITTPALSFIDDSFAQSSITDSINANTIFKAIHSILLEILDCFALEVPLVAPTLGLGDQACGAGALDLTIPDLKPKFQLVDSVRPLLEILLSQMKELMDSPDAAAHHFYQPFIKLYQDVLLKTKDLFVSKSDLQLWKKTANVWIQLQTLNSVRNTNGILVNLKTGTARHFIISHLSKDEMDKRYLHNGVKTLSGPIIEKMVKFCQF